MKRFIVVAALAASLSACIPPVPPTPTPPQSLSDACLAPLASGQPDPQPRDVHMLADPANQRVIVSMCVVSNSATPYAGIAATVTVFTADGQFTSYSDAGVNYTSPVVSNVPGAPPIIATIADGIPVDPKYVAIGLKKSVMIRLYAYRCVGGTDTGKTCTVDNGNVSTQTFMRDIVP